MTFFNKDCLHLNSVQKKFKTCKNWIPEGLKHIHGFGLVYRDFKEDNIVLYQVGSLRARAVIIDFGKCQLESNRIAYSLSDIELTTKSIDMLLQN